MVFQLTYFIYLKSSIRNRQINNILTSHFNRGINIDEYFIKRNLKYVRGIEEISVRYKEFTFKFYFDDTKLVLVKINDVEVLKIEYDCYFSQLEVETIKHLDDDDANLHMVNLFKLLTELNDKLGDLFLTIHRKKESRERIKVEKYKKDLKEFYNYVDRLRNEN